jgi:hypothetical protein
MKERRAMDKAENNNNLNFFSQNKFGQNIS